MEDSSVLILYKMPSYLISLFDVKLIKLPIYESADDEDGGFETVSLAIDLKY